MRRTIIALDGPAGAGKTTVGARLAERLGWAFVDTGLLYRALTWLARERGVSVDDEAGLAALAETLEVRVVASESDGENGAVIVNGTDATRALRSPAVDREVSLVAAVPAVRRARVEPQRRAVGAGPAVVAGRDIGTVIFPCAPLKVYLEASVGER